MIPREFLDRVAEPNADSAIHANGDLQAAVNAVLSLDAFFGILHPHLKCIGDEGSWTCDIQHREHIADLRPEHRVVRYMAVALKHVLLTGKTPRLVSKSGQLGGRVPAVGEMVSNEYPLGEVVVFIGDISGSTSERVERFAAQVSGFIRGLLARQNL